ncbi:hypothetical protein QBC34DRAFT_393993 [Podospora aff. communis PSN243]|uniref:Alpha/beta-hydrolase n=1 Tax=Podospora aff. communis PSN243 TaxID=3040156 RepID=A0AAV9H0F0_9PEZI|nr:hypothetical protein QBC34DRAFT_393993 [Podospora aff. communis PSN243]
MRRWLPPLRTWRVTRPQPPRSGIKWRYFSAHSVEHIQVPTASAGEITVSLHNTEEHSSTSPLVLWIPPFSFCDGYNPAELVPPQWLGELPTVTLNYRWTGLFTDPATVASSTPRQWPLPLHDVLFGYQWVRQHLAPADLARRDIYVYGSYLGASLAVSLALTESHAHEPMAIRGLIAYNGIYNWTTFLPDHPINKPPAPPKGRKRRPLLTLHDEPDPEPKPASSSPNPFHLLRQQSPLLFSTPANLFDPFASPTLFFHTSGLLVPPDFHSSALEQPAPSEFTSAVNALASGEPLSPSLSQSQSETPLERATRKAYLTFPPRKSTLQIPHALLLYDPPLTPVQPNTKSRKKSSTAKRKRPAEPNSFHSQAMDLADAMTRSVDMLELRDRMKWDSTYEDPEVRAQEAERRVSVVEVGRDAEDGRDRGLGVLDLNERGEGVARRWLRGRCGGEEEGGFDVGEGAQGFFWGV